MFRQLNTQAGRAARSPLQFRILHHDFHRKTSGVGIGSAGHKTDNAGQLGAIQQLYIDCLPRLNQRRRLLGDLPGGFQAVYLYQFKQRGSHLYQAALVHFAAIHNGIKRRHRFEVVQGKLGRSQLGSGGCKLTLEAQDFGFRGQIAGTQLPGGGQIRFQLANTGLPALYHRIPTIRRQGRKHRTRFHLLPQLNVQLLNGAVHPGTDLNRLPGLQLALKFQGWLISPGADRCYLYPSYGYLFGGRLLRRLITGNFYLTRCHPDNQ